MRKIKFTNGEYYHVFNRGVDKRNVFLDQKDLERFNQSMIEFNTFSPIGSIYALSFRKNKNKLRNLVPKSGSKSSSSPGADTDFARLVDFICYCLCPNHYHFILRQSLERGIEKFMHRLGLGYTNYFNKKYNRNGSLFQGTFKANHIDSNEYLLYASAYVNLNHRIHKLESTDSLVRSSWENYVEQNEQKEKDLCETDIILGQFAGISEYKRFAGDIVKIAREKKDLEKILKLDLEN